ncbi:EAGR box-containing protein [Mycoplasma tullyi]|uniref:EAGR box-containing protein n=1 Tax=Mycoplasma tullyi TaxID=1612150 RepID=UPI00225E2337|nr:EAGR box-containing protein [Mycoplasma tullyi]
MAKKTKNKKKDNFEDDIDTTESINEEESEAIFGNLYDGAEEVLPASLAYENGQLPEDGSIQVAFDADDNAYYISYDPENEIFIEPYEKYELDASALYDAEGNPFDFFANYYVEGAEAEEESGEYWEQFIGVEGYGYYDENEEWVWSGYFDEDNNFIPNEDEVVDDEAVEEEVEAAQEEEQPEEVVEEESQEEEQVEAEAEEQPEEVVEEPAEEEQPEEEVQVEAEEQPEEVVEEEVEAAPEEVPAEEYEQEADQAESGEYWEQFIGVEGYGYYDENNEWVWAGYFDENNNFVPEYYDESGQPVSEEQYAEPVSEEQVAASEEQPVEEPVAEEQPVEEEVQAQEVEEQPEEVVEESSPQEEVEVAPEEVPAEQYEQQPEQAQPESGEYWEQFIGVEGYGYYDENNEWVWAGYFDENNNFVPEYYDESGQPVSEEQYAEPVSEEQVAASEEQPVEEPAQPEEVVEEPVVEQQPEEAQPEQYEEEVQVEEQPQEAESEEAVEQPVVEQQPEEVVAEEATEQPQEVVEESAPEEQVEVASEEAVAEEYEQQPEAEEVQAEEYEEAQAEEQPEEVAVEEYDQQPEEVQVEQYEETQPEQYEEEVQYEEQQPEEVLAEQYDQHPEDVMVDTDNQFYDEFTHVEDEGIDKGLIQTDDVVSGDEINWSHYVGDEYYGYYNEDDEWVWRGYFNEYGMFIPQQEDYTDSVSLDEQAVEQMAEQALEDVVGESATDDEFVQYEEVESESVEPALPAVIDDGSTVEPSFGFDIQQFIGNIDFGYYDESSEWIWTGHFDEAGNFYDFDGNLIYTPEQGVLPGDVPKSTDPSQNALVVVESEEYAENIIQQIDDSQIDVGEEFEIRGLLNPAATPAQPEELKITPVFEEEKLSLPVAGNEVNLQPQEQVFDFSKRSDSDQLLAQAPVVLEDAVADDVISVDTNSFVPEASQQAFAPTPINLDQFNLVQQDVIQPIISQPKYDQITHLTDEIKVDVNVASSDVDVQPININPSLEVESQASKLDFFIKKPVEEVKKIEFVEPVAEKIDLQIFEQPEVVTKPVSTIQQPTYIDETLPVSVNVVDEPTFDTDTIVQVTPTINEVSDFDINNILKTKPVEVVNLELPKDEVKVETDLQVSVVDVEPQPVDTVTLVDVEAKPVETITLDLPENEPKFETGLQVTVIDVDAQPVKEIVEFDSPKPTVEEVLVEKEDKVTLVEEEPFFNKFIGNEEYGYYNDKNVWVWNGYFDDENNFVSDKETQTQKVDLLIEEFTKQEEINKSQESQEVVVEKEDKVTLVEEEPFFNKFIGNEDYGYYNDKNVWVWNGYFDENDQFVPDQSSVTKSEEVIEEFSKQEESSKPQESQEVEAKSVEPEKASEPFFNKFIGNEQFGYYNDKNVWIWNGYFDENDQFVPDQSSTKKSEKLIEDELQKQRIHELELELAKAQQAILESAKLKDQEVAKIKEEVVKAQQETTKPNELITLNNFVPKASPLLSPAKEVENQMIVYQNDKFELNNQHNELHNEISKPKVYKEEFDSFSNIRDLDVISLHNASTSRRGSDYVFSGFEKKEEQFVNKPLHFLEEVKVDPVKVAKEESMSNVHQFFKQDSQLLLPQKQEVSSTPETSLTVLADNKEVESTAQAVNKPVEIIQPERVDVIKPLEQVQLEKPRSLLDDLSPKFEVKSTSIKDDLITPKYDDKLEPIEQLQFKQERSLLDDYMPKFDDQQGLFNKVEFKLPTVNREYRPKVEPIDVIKPLEPVQINKERSLLDDYVPPKFNDQFKFETKSQFSDLPKFDEKSSLEKTALDLGLEQPLANGELYEELKAEFSTADSSSSKDMIDQLLEETNDLINSSTLQQSAKVDSFTKSSLDEPILDTKFDDKFMELDENQGFDQLIVEGDDEVLTDVVQEVELQLDVTEPVIQQQVSANQIAVTNEEYKKDMAELKQFLEKRSEELFKQYFSKFEELTKLQMESFNQIKNQLRSEMNDIREEVRSNQLALTSEITEEIYPSSPKVSRKQRTTSNFGEPTSEFDFDNSLSLVNENNYDLYELIDRIMNYEDVQLTTSNVFKSEEYQAKVKQSIQNIKQILKNSEAEATKNYNYILSTLKNEIALLQKDLPIISSQLNKLQHDVRVRQLSANDHKFIQEQIQELRAEHANKTRAISFYNKKISDLKSIYAQQIRKIKSDYKRISDLANKRNVSVSNDYIDQAIRSFESARMSQPNASYESMRMSQPTQSFESLRASQPSSTFESIKIPQPNLRRNYEQLYRNQFNQSVNNNYGNFRRYDPIVDNHGYEYFSNHQPKEFFSELESIDNDIFNSNDLIYSNRNTYLDENFRINDYELTSNFDDIDAIHGMDKLRLPPFEPNNSMSDLEFNSTFDIDLDNDF